MNTIATEEITRWVDPKQLAKVEKKAAASGIAEIWQHGLSHCDQTGSEEEVCKRAAVRAQQLCGCIPRVLDEPVGTEPARKAPGKAKSRADKSEPAAQEPGAELPPIETQPAQDE